ncbi:YdcF family protein [Rhodopirellula sp. JC639]|uniref:YdcF family protein n=1 Tax=Stieleria mannarensis TaxID=2755585 RepID=UPI0016023090|nr:YdcF family protein [Rhodopirellula sp. JC639]
MLSATTDHTTRPLATQPTPIKNNAKESQSFMGSHEDAATAPNSQEAFARPIGWFRASLIGVVAAGVLAVALVTWAGIQGGRSPAERTATSLVMPVAVIWLSLLAATIASAVRKCTPLAVTFAVAWLAFSIVFNGWVAGHFLRSLEYPATADPAGQLTQPLDAVVLLGGYAHDNRFDVPQLGHDGQRLLLAAQLWHAGKTKTLICTGTGTDDYRDPSRIGRQMLTSVGVPDHVIFEVPGVNTDAEMIHLKSFFEAPPDAWLQLVGPRRGSPAEASRRGDSIGLVTSAVHLSRAMRLAEKRGLEFTPLGCNFNGRPIATLSPRDMIPSAGAGRSFAIALKEQLAWVVGR